MRRQRTTPFVARSGPISTNSANSASCAAERRGGVALRPAVLQPLGAALIEAVHPVAQRLAIHAADARRIRPAHPVQHRRNRQEPPALIGVLRGRRKPPKLSGREIRSDLHPCCHARIPPRHGISSTRRTESPTSQNGRPLV